MSSLRQPKCIIIRGNDQREHKYLVKGGEDQRQDERIESLFAIINGLLRSDSKCSQRNLELRTYQVIPMTCKLALIEWIPHTRTLRDVIMDARTDAERAQWDQFPPDQVHHTFILNTLIEEKQQGGEKEAFALAHTKYTREHVAATFRLIEDMVPWDLLRRFVRSMAASSEAYFVLRNQFVVSYAVACTCQYVLGIGDRHLKNWLMDTRSGKAVAIDFGMAFGHATINIPVPELMPVRLTRQILKLAAPLEKCGLLEASMLHTLRALRDNNDLLMCILDVFVKEPSIDWIVWQIINYYEITLS